MGLFLSCCCLLVLTLTSAVYAAPAPDISAQPEASVSAFTNEVVNIVNQERAKAGLPALSVSPELTLSAQRYAAYMAEAGFFGHQGPDGSTFISRNTAAGYTGWTNMAENLAAGQSSPRAVVDAWLNSPGHRANIFNASVRETGVGHAGGGKYGNYWVQEFGSRGGAPAPAPAPKAAPAPAPAPPPAAAPAPSSRSGARPAPAAAAPAPAPAPKPVRKWVSPETGRSVSGDWLAYVEKHGGVDNFGLPRSEVVSDWINKGQTVQYFQRMVLEYHPDNPDGFKFQRRLLGDILYPENDPPVDWWDAPPGPNMYYWYSPDKPTGLGHFVADVTRSGQPIYFKEYFDSHGGVDVFGYPKEEPKLRDGIWTQRFQAAVFQYHPEMDKDGTIPGTNIPYRAYRVQTELLGDTYIALKGLKY